MKVRDSIRARLVIGATVVLVAFVAGAGLALQRAHADSARSARYAQLQSTVYLLLAGAELDAAGGLVMPAGFPEPRLSTPSSGIYANIVNVARSEQWRSPSTAGVAPPFRREAAVGEWRFETIDGPGAGYLAATYGVNWAGRTSAAPLVLSVMEDKGGFDREVAIFERTSWTWLGGAALLLLISQTLLLEWGLAPLRRIVREVQRVEAGEHVDVQGEYPAEIEPLTKNLNTLIHQERVRQTRYREALSFLAHSLKTPLAVLRTGLDTPGQLPSVVAEQVARMDDIVQHQLARAAASGTARFVPYLRLAPVAARIRESLAKVHAGRGLEISVACPPDLQWRLDEGDAFELLGNLMDNACKWAGHRVVATLQQESGRLCVRVEDDGPGFGDTAGVLQLGVRGDEKTPGHGVGLTIVNDLVTSHEGELRLSRSALGGAQVDVSLPGA